MLVLQYDIVQSITIVSKSLQTEGMNFEPANNLLESALNKHIEMRNSVSQVKNEVVDLAKKWNVTPQLEKKHHNKHRSFFDEIAEDARFSDNEKNFEVTIFNITLDIIVTKLKQRFEGMNYVINMFNF